MRYLFAVVLPLLIQCLVVFIIIQANTGNGSWAGLGALLIGMFAIPATAIINGILVYANREKPFMPTLSKCLLIALAAPFATIFLLFLG